MDTTTVIIYVVLVISMGIAIVEIVERFSKEKRRSDKERIDAMFRIDLDERIKQERHPASTTKSRNKEG